MELIQTKLIDKECVAFEYSAEDETVGYVEMVIAVENRDEIEEAVLNQVGQLLAGVLQETVRDVSDDDEA